MFGFACTESKVYEQDSFMPAQSISRTRSSRYCAARYFFPLEALRRVLKRFQAKWTPVRVKKTRQIKNLEPRFDSIETEKALA
jgi:hypothetical protein